jgi:pyruvate formate lyase activating enzyme
MTGRIFDIKRFAIHDGPGLRTTVFLKSCPLRCVWCQNPEGLNFESALWINREKCIRCGACVACCPENALQLTEQGAVLNGGRCNLCAAAPRCLEKCPSKAITRIDREVSSGGLVKELGADKVFFDVSGPSGEKGGVTLSGGEPLAQSDFTLELLAALKEAGIHTCIETSLFAPEAVIQQLPALVDYLICDIKIFDEADHRQYTGQSNAGILANFKYLAAKIPALLVRVPMIPGITATEKNLRAIGQFVRTQGAIPVELLNFNWFSSSKYGILRQPHFNPEARAFSDEDMARFNEMVSCSG